MSQILKIQMLGGFSLSLGDRTVDDSSNRMRKVWLLLAYLIHSRNSRITQEGFLSLLQGSGEDSADPAGRLKTMLYRVRTMLNQMEEDAGHRWIIRRDGAYGWNPEIPVSLDVEEFEQLCRQADSAPEEMQIELYRRALVLYRGDFLPKLSMEPWVVPLNAYYHRLYVETVQKALALLEKQGLWQEAQVLCRKALQLEPYSEELYQHLMHCQISTEDRQAALHTYEKMSEMLFSNFGVMPSEESRELYRRAASNAAALTVPISGLRDQLRESEAARGALHCEYDFFRMLYQLQARAIVRTGDIIHIALFSVRGQGGKELSRRSLNTAMDNFQEILIRNLRRGDVVTRCSISQLIIMLPQANYENSCMVCQRLLEAFARQYPHSPVSIHYSVQPLEPKE